MVKILKTSLTEVDLALVAGPCSPIDALAVLVHPSLGVVPVCGVAKRAVNLGLC